MTLSRSLHGLLLALVLLAAPHVAAQPDHAATLPPAEASFQRGLTLYSQGQYLASTLLFQETATAYGYNTLTTASYLMLGKAHYASGSYDAALGALTTLIQTYPRSRYVPEARRLLADVTARRSRTPSGPFRLGILLPDDRQNRPATQALFNGIRLAVDAHNAAHPERPVQMVFRNSQGTAEGTRLAMGLALRQGVEAVIGPLFSAEALAAADEAERAQVPLLAPLATDDALTAQRRYVFQVNMPFAQRGEAMAHYAVERLGIPRFGVLTQQGTYGETMASAFRTTAERLGTEVHFYETLPDARAWARLADRLTTDQVVAVDAIYAPVTGRDADDIATDVLEGIDALGVTTLILGGTEWDAVTNADLASHYTATFTQDYYVRSTDDLRAFNERYRALAGIDADRVAYAGYDTARFLLAQVMTTADQSLADQLRAAPRHDGLGHRIAFDGGQINKAVFICGFRDGQLVLIE